MDLFVGDDSLRQGTAAVLLDPRPPMTVLAVRPLAAPPDVAITVPGSKSITNRALILAALAEGRSDLSNVLF